SLGSPALAATIQGCYFLALFIFLQVALFRSRRYRLSRTTWRGIYAGPTGSTWHYLGLFLAYGLLTVVTLRLPLPWMHFALARYKLTNSCFGNRTLYMESRGSALSWRWLIVLALIVVPVALAVLPNLSALSHPVYVPQPKGPPRLQAPHPGAFAFFFFAFFL